MILMVYSCMDMQMLHGRFHLYCNHLFISYVIFLNRQSGMIESVCKHLTSTVPQSIMEAELFAICELLRSVIRTKHQLVQDASS